ncbi:MAG: LysR family transcriptional regulator [Breznakibacter sp.]|nr:LysR family transcriptional regulator [Breznakibacter sp.]
MIFDFRLKVFQTVADNLSFTKAAKTLLISQPAVTRHINELERQLGVRLFRRLGNGIELTAEGDLLQSHARKIFSQYRAFEEELGRIQNVNSGSLLMGASTTISQYILPGILAQFKKRFPDVKVQLFSGNTETIEHMLLAEQIDLGLIEGNSNLVQIHYENFVKDEIVLVARVGNRLLQKQEMALGLLPSIPLVLREAGSGTLDVIEAALKSHNIVLSDLNVEMQIGSTEGIKHYIQNSDAAAFLSIHTITRELAANQLMIVDVRGFDIVRTLQFISLHGRSTHLTNVFKAFCLRQYKI